MVTYPHKNGFTLIELMIVVAIIGVIAAIAYPNYQESVKKTKRGDMMATLQNIASDIQSQKLAKGNYEAVTTSTLIGDYPKQGSNKLYNVTLMPSPLTENWKITATPIAAGQMATDGDLTLDATGIKCRNLDTTKKYCGTSTEWNK